MNYQPELNDELCAAAKIKALIRKTTSVHTPNDPDIEGSHIHGCYEIYINLCGDVSFFVGENLYPIVMGDIILSAPGEFHHCIYNSSKPHEHICIWFDTSYASELSEFIEKSGRVGRIRLTSEGKARLTALIDELTNSLGIRKTMLFFELLRLVYEGECEGGERSAFPKKLQQIIDYVSAHYTELYSTEQIARHFHLSLPTVNRWFRDYAHISPGKLLRAKKLAYAGKLLREDHSVTEACYLAGFSDLSRFIRDFCKAYGKTPLKYKKAIEAHTDS